MSECQHHWMIQSPDGPAAVGGTCRKCGATSEFSVSGMPTEASKTWMNRPPFGQGWKRRKQDAATKV